MTGTALMTWWPVPKALPHNAFYRWLHWTKHIAQHAQRVECGSKATEWCGLNHCFNDFSARYTKVQRSLSELTRLIIRTQSGKTRHGAQHALAVFESGSKPNFAVAVFDGDWVECAGYRV